MAARRASTATATPTRRYTKAAFEAQQAEFAAEKARLEAELYAVQHRVVKQTAQYTAVHGGCRNDSVKFAADASGLDRDTVDGMYNGALRDTTIDVTFRLKVRGDSVYTYNSHAIDFNDAAENLCNMTGDEIDYVEVLNITQTTIEEADES